MSTSLLLAIVNASYVNASNLDATYGIVSYNQPTTLPVSPGNSHYDKDTPPKLDFAQTIADHDAYEHNSSRGPMLTHTSADRPDFLQATTLGVNRKNSHLRWRSPRVGASRSRKYMYQNSRNYAQYARGGQVENMQAVERGAFNLPQAVVILIIGVGIIIANIIVLATLITMPGQKDLIMYYLMSLSCADLIVGVSVVPLSVYPALVNRWVYGKGLCGLTGYVGITIWLVQLYTFMWISVDRYLAIEKPLRYETVQTKTHCQCWVVFTWVTSMMLCCPPLLGFNNSSHWDVRAFVCWLDWDSMLAYGFTLVPMVLGPTLITLVYTYIHIFYTKIRLKQCIVGQEKEFITALTANIANPDHTMSFVLVLMFWLSWAPCLLVRTYEYLSGNEIHIRYLHFIVFWVGALNSFWKCIIYVALSPKFRRSLKLFCLSLCCRRHRREHEDMMDY